MALASLTANYYDSEDELETSEESPKPTQNESVSTNENENVNTNIEEEKKEDGPPPPPTPPVANNDAENVSDEPTVPLEIEEKPAAIKEDRLCEFLPPEPVEEMDDRLKYISDKLYERFREGCDFNKLIQERKEFRNPSIYKKLIEYCGIDEFGTNLPPEIHDPSKWKPEAFYDHLSKVQNSLMERLLEEQKAEKHKLDKSKADDVKVKKSKRN